MELSIAMNRLFIPEFSGSTAVAVTSACMMYILFIMLLMTVRLYSRQRSGAYILFIAALLLIAFERTLDLTDYEWFPGWFDQYGIGRTALQAFSFLLMNLAVLRLYKRSNRRMRVYALAALLLLAGAAALSLILAEQYGMSAKPTWPLIVYHMTFTVFCYFWIGPRAGQRVKYAFTLLVNFLMNLSSGVNSIYFSGMNMLLFYLEHALPLVYFTLMFFILFERVVEHLQRTYRSSITDGLTQLYNRRYLFKAMQSYAQKDAAVSLIFCDIDNFKRLNDTQGHDKADDELKLVSAIIREEVEEAGIPGRFGGEELVALIVDPHARVKQLAENIRRRVEAETSVTVSVGHSTLRSGMTPEELVREADQAMYHSKTTGKNRVTDYETIGSPRRRKRASAGGR